MTIKILNECERRVDGQSEKFNKELENTKKSQTKLKHKIT